MKPILKTAGDYFLPMWRGSVSLDPVRNPRPLTPEDMPAITLTYNSQRLIPAFLEHYRLLGITRFLVVDDGSTDGTLEFLGEQPDVDVFRSNVRYSQAYRGRLWREMLINRFGRGRWYVLVDSDEFLIYPGYETKTLSTLAAELKSAGILHFPAPMLDMYPPGLVNEATYTYAPGKMPWTVANMYDASGYTLRGGDRTWLIQGGIRLRCFGSGTYLMKYPLMFWDRKSSLNRSIHFPAPYWRNFAEPGGALLHFKFFDGFYEEFQTVVNAGQHYGGSLHYQEMLDRIANPEKLVLENEVSQPFRGAHDLLERGFFRDLT